MTRDELIEIVADLEHEQWVSWSKAIIDKKDCQIGTRTLSVWENLCWRAYKDLPEVEKDKDRIWAKKLVYLLEEKQILKKD